ncbi:MAG: hypothetical protein AB3X44_00975 [Leptothrix sp. (in: b-proteobacteria)]
MKIKKIGIGLAKPGTANRELLSFSDAFLTYSERSKLCITRYTEGRAGDFERLKNPTPDGARIGLRQARLSRAAPLLLALSLLLQLPAAVQSLFAGS